MTDLIARLEAAEGPDPRLDREIAVIQGGYKEVGWPAYTTSMDAALTLVPEGHTYSFIHRIGEYPEASVAAQPDAGFWSAVVATAATPALALCIAALKARDDD